MNKKKSLFRVHGLGLALVISLLMIALGACTIPKGGGTDTGPPT
jgi:hypothetical protein